MATRAILKLVIQLLSIPFIVSSRYCELTNFLCIHGDINNCLKLIDSLKNAVPQPFILSLVAVEDHRNAIHKGVDPIAMIRAAYVRLRNGGTQGASTIEQQFVRVATNRFERTIRRKVREQILAIAVSRRRGKFEIASTYLSIAFYGSGSIGLTGLKSHCGDNLTTANESDIFTMIARLKYPKPLSPSKQWERTLQRRVEHIKDCLDS